MKRINIEHKVVSGNGPHTKALQSLLAEHRQATEQLPLCLFVSPAAMAHLLNEWGLDESTAKKGGTAFALPCTDGDNEVVHVPLMMVSQKSICEIAEYQMKTFGCDDDAGPLPSREERDATPCVIGTVMLAQNERALVGAIVGHPECHGVGNPHVLGEYAIDLHLVLDSFTKTIQEVAQEQKNAPAPPVLHPSVLVYKKDVPAVPCLDTFSYLWESTKILKGTPLYVVMSPPFAEALRKECAALAWQEYKGLSLREFMFGERFNGLTVHVVELNDKMKDLLHRTEDTARHLPVPQVEHSKTPCMYIDVLEKDRTVRTYGGRLQAFDKRSQDRMQNDRQSPTHN